MGVPGKDGRPGMLSVWEGKGVEDRPVRLPSAAAEAITPTEAVARRLEEDIVLGRLLPRERLVEDELMTRFDASRHIVRQALMELDRIGLVQRVRNRGAVVRNYSQLELEQLHDLRRLLEGEAAGLIVLPLEPRALEELTVLQRSHDRAVETGDLAAVFRSNHAFHRRLFECCDNAFLVEAIEAAALKAHGVRSLPMRSPRRRLAARDQHHAMIAALRGDDRDVLVRLCQDHVATMKTPYDE